MRGWNGSRGISCRGWQRLADEDRLQERFGTLRTSDANGECSPVRLGSELERQKRAALAFRNHEFRHQFQAILLAGNSEGVPVSKLFGGSDGRLELQKNRCRGSWLTRRRNHAVHPQILDHLPVVIESMNQRLDR
jgi:hypothetical protein